jgi:hypothetical protein
MRLAGAVISGAVLAGVAAAAAASGHAARTIALRPGGYVYVSGTSIRCGAVRDQGITFVSCGVVLANGNAKSGSYVAAMQSNGRVAIIRAVKPIKTVFDRTPAAVVRLGAKVVAKPADRIVVPGTSIACNVGLVSGKATIFCDYITSSGGARPGSYSFGIGDTIVTSLGWDAKSHIHLLGSWPENG